MDKKYNVLVVDDSSLCRQLARSYLDYWNKNQLNLKFAENGQEALDLVDNLMTNGGIDLILMDIKMPVIGGIEANNRIREIYKNQNLTPPKIIAVTSHALHGDRERFISSGFDDYLSKPLPKEEFYKTLDKYLN